MPIDATPPPQASPHPGYVEPAKTPTGEFPATKGDILAHEAREAAELKRGLTLETLKTGAIVLVAVTGGIFGAWRILLSEARAQTDAGVTVVALEARATQRELERFQREASDRFSRLEQSSQRAEVKLDALLSRLQVVNPAPTPAKDGGQ